MDHLVMGQGQDVVFTGGIGASEGHLVMVEFRKYGSNFIYSRKSCIHPIFHLKVKPRPPPPVPCDAGPCGGFLGDHDGSGHMARKDAVQMAEEFDGLQIFIFFLTSGSTCSVVRSLGSAGSISNFIQISVADDHADDNKQ